MQKIANFTSTNCNCMKLKLWVVLPLLLLSGTNGFCRQWDKESASSPNDVEYLLEKARMAFHRIPDHKRVDEAAKPFMSADLYESLAAAWDVPDWLDGEMGNEEFLFYFITGNDPSDRQQIESATLVSAQQGRYTVDVKYREFRGGTASQNLSSISLVLVNEDGNILLDDFGQETKQHCKQYVREEVSDFLSGKTNQYMKDHQGGRWYTDSHIAGVNESFKVYLSTYGEYIGRLGM